MYSTVMLLISGGFYLFYHTSSKINTLEQPEYLAFLRRKPVLSKLLGSSILTLAAVTAVRLQGTLPGFFALFAYIMASGSLIVLLSPLRYLKWGHLLLLFLICLMLETLVF